MKTKCCCSIRTQFVGRLSFWAYVSIGDHKISRSYSIAFISQNHYHSCFKAHFVRVNRKCVSRNEDIKFAVGFSWCNEIWLDPNIHVYASSTESLKKKMWELFFFFNTKCRLKNISCQFHPEYDYKTFKFSIIYSSW